MKSERRRRNLVTMNDVEGKPLPLDHSLLALIELLDKCCSQELLQVLGEIGCELYDKELDKANEILLKKYASGNFIEKVSPLKKSDGTEDFFFTPHAMKILNTLLVFNCTHRMILNFQNFTKINGLHIPLSTSSENAQNLPIIDLFLLTNQLVADVQNNSSNSKDEFLADVALYYSQIFEDTNASIGRAQLLYNNSYFNQMLAKEFGISILELSEYLFVLFAHVNTHRPAKIDPGSTFNKIKNNDQKTKITKILNHLSLNVQSKLTKYSLITSSLRNDYIQDKVTRGKPFLKIKERHICIRPDLLTSAFGNFPYFYLLNSLNHNQKNNLFNEFGKAFEKYIEIIAERSLGDKSITHAHKNSNESSDRHIIINEESRAIIEIKSSRENDNTMLGSLKDLKDKFIHLKGTKKNPKGVLQLIKDIEKYRNESGFNGKIFPIIIFYGNFPETSDFDELVENEINKQIEYQIHLQNNNNYPTIWLSCTTAELFFCLTKQEPSCLEETLIRLASKPPSKVKNEILKLIAEKKLSSSLSILFRKELEQLLEKSKEMINED